MKIEVELLKIDQDTDKARACVVALLSALPRDDAELAVREWRAVLIERQIDEAVKSEEIPPHWQQPVFDPASVPPQDDGPPAELKAGFAAARDEISALQEAATIPPQDVGYSATEKIRQSSVVRPRGRGEVPQDGPYSVTEAAEFAAEEARAEQVPDYEVGGWVVTDLGELAKVAALIDDRIVGPCLLVEVDEGEQHLTEKMLNFDRVRPATVAEVTAGAARAAMVPPPVQDAGEKKKRGRPKKVTTPPEPNGSAAETAAVEVTPPEFTLRDFPTQEAAPADVWSGKESLLQRMIDQEKAVKYEATSLKDLCKLAEHHAGRPKLFDLFKEHGVGKLDGADAGQLAALRASVLELVP